MHAVNLEAEELGESRAFLDKAVDERLLAIKEYCEDKLDDLGLQKAETFRL